MKVGLAVVHGIMDNHGGSVTVRSQRGESTGERIAHVRGPFAQPLH
jgi:nitrogen fixation/metabolism regulation signal transduction histidine kinase